VTEAVHDPYEGFNRRVFAFNEDVDDVVIEPVTNVYTAVTPRLARRRLADFIDNLRTPIWFANDVLQGDLGDASRQVGRFGINLTFGFLGFYDFASAELGMAREPEDFGQTLGVWGVPEGPYLVVPLLGPSTLRDGPGRAVDIAFDPLTWTQFSGDAAFATGRRTVRALEGRARGGPTLDRIRMSPDPYVALRSIYLQNRRGEINEQGDPYADLPEFDEFDEP
jgi:phospholipid-binding lipoprotein MlaA